MALKITHTYQDGTLLDGTSKADMPVIREVLRSFAWKWSRTLGMWFQQSSRDQLPRMYRIEQTAARLRELGYTVEIDIDSTPRAMAEQETDRAQRMDDRAGALDAKADRRQAESDQRRTAADSVFSAIPFGQPLLVDHHSYSADKNRRERALSNLGKSITLAEQAASAADRAETARGHMDRRNHPRAVLSRIHALETQLREAERGLAGREGWTTDDLGNDVWGHVEPGDTAREYWQTIKADLENKLTHWRAVHADNVAKWPDHSHWPGRRAQGQLGASWWHLVPGRSSKQKVRHCRNIPRC